jgi:hypothetical protein
VGETGLISAGVLGQVQPTIRLLQEGFEGASTGPEGGNADTQSYPDDAPADKYGRILSVLPKPFGRAKRLVGIGAFQ